MESRLKQLGVLAAVFALATGASAKAETAPILSPFPSTVTGLDMPNTHLFRPGIYRGSAPRGAQIDELRKFGMTDVLIFREEKNGEVAKEEEALKQSPGPPIHVTHIPFRWKDFSSFQEACGQTLEALDTVFEAEGKLKPDAPGPKLYFHCNVGEDRTGYLAGLLRMLDDHWNKRKAFDDEMCLNGYGEGNPRKPLETVVLPIRKQLTPLFLKMARLIERGQLARAHFPQGRAEISRACQNDPGLSEAADDQPEKFQCHSSPLYPAK